MTKTHALIPVLMILSPTSVHAGLEFCNETDAKVSVAIGYQDDGIWTSEGWWGAEPGACTTVVGGDLTRRYFYWRATSARYSWEDRSFMFCTSPDAFTIVGDTECSERGYERNSFNELDLDGAPSFSMRLTAEGATIVEPRAAQDPSPLEYDEPAAGDPGFGPQPGTFGEPYTISGILSHCDYYDAGIGCTVLADGWSYLATSYDHTDEDDLVFLDGLGVNIPVEISGDLISYEGTEAVVTIREYRETGRDPLGQVRADLQGFWTSTDDAAYQVLIHGSTFEEHYNQIPDAPLAMHFRNGCDDAPGDGTAFDLVSRDATEDRCVFATRVGGGNLELFVAGTMKPLTFRRTN